MTDAISLQSGDALLVIDVQNDFCPSGALPVPDGDQIVPVINRWIEQAQAKGVPVYASRDWHPRTHPSFAPEGGPWPVHCVQDTAGAAFHPDLRLPRETIVVTKGTRFDQDQYSAFDQTGLAKALADQGVRRVIVCGLAEDVCVRATALDAKREGLAVLVLKEATRAISDDSRRTAEAEMVEAGVDLIAPS